MKVTVRLFGATRLAVGYREREMTLSEPATVAGLVEEFVRQAGPTARECLLDPRGQGYFVAFGVNGQAAEPDTALREGDVVAFVPPTAGG